MENDRWLLEGWGEDEGSHHYQTCMLALLNLAEINVHVMKSQENRFVMFDACMFCLCCCAVLELEKNDT